MCALQSARSNGNGEGVGTAVTPRVASRVPIFSPTRRPQSREAWRVDTPWGWAIITGRLGQQHRDLLDAARAVAVAEQWTADGRLHLKLDPAVLRATMGGDHVNGRRILEWIEDLRVARVEVHVGDRVVVGGLISEYEISSDPTILRPRPGARGGDRKYMRMSFSTGWSKLVESDKSMRYPLACVVRLKHGFSQALARFCLSHQQVHDTVAGMMAKLGAKGRARDYRESLAEDADALRDIGIEVNGNTVRWSIGRDQSPVKGWGRDQSPVKRDQSPVKKHLLQIYQVYQGQGGAKAPPCPSFLRPKTGARAPTLKKP